VSSQAKAAIVGLGITELGKVYGKSALQFGAQAVQLAAEDAGLTLSDVDGLLVSSGLAGDDLHLNLQTELGMKNLKLLSYIQAYGSTAAALVQYATMAVESGMVDTVAVVWADAPLKENLGAGAAYNQASRGVPGWRGLTATAGITSANTMYALAARRHMKKYGTTNDHFGAIAVAQRQWAELNPLALFRQPLTLDDYHASRWIAEPFHLLDCCMVTNGGIAVIVTSKERAKDLKQPPVGVFGWGQTHPGGNNMHDENFGLVSGAAISGPIALKMADTTIDEIDVVEVYDCYTYTALVTLEDYGFAPKGEGGAFLAQPGVLGPGGSLPVNTGGGELSGYYLWGMTPLSEAVIQARGQGGDREVEKHDRVMVSGNGGILDHHSTLVLGTL